MESQTPKAAELNLALTDRAPQRAREFSDQVASWAALARERASDMRLLVSELVTNSVRHANTGTIRLRANLDDQRLAVEVHDDGPGVGPLPGKRRALAASGHGLRVVEWLAD